MGYILKHDLYKQIKATELDILLEEVHNGDQELAHAIEAAQSEAWSYIRHAYDVETAFPDIFNWEYGKTYAQGQIVYFHVDAVYDAAATYQVGDFVVASGDRVYRSNTANNTGNAVTDATHWEYVATHSGCYWEAVTTTQSILVTAGTWDEISDPRDALIVRILVDLVLYDLHSRIKPRQIPEHRIQRRDDAIQFLTNAADPRKNVFLTTPEVDHGANSGTDLTFGHSPSDKYSY